jgi:hypothetical protein
MRAESKGGLGIALYRVPVPPSWLDGRLLRRLLIIRAEAAIVSSARIARPSNLEGSGFKNFWIAKLDPAA